MTSIARRLLDELMGPDRNKPLWLQGQSSVRYTQAEVCKYYLIGFCPHELFLNTKSDIGQCPWRIHDPMIKEEFEQKGEPAHREAYERQFHEKCWELVRDLERKLKRGKERLDLPGEQMGGVNEEVDEKRMLLEHQIKEVMAQVERLGEEGRVREAQERMVQADMLQAEMDRLKQLESDNPLYRLEKKMELCPTCGAFLIVNDAPMRIQAHYAGRQHNGWVQLRNSLEKYKATKRSFRGEDHRHSENRYESRNDHHDDHRRDSRDSGSQRRNSYSSSSYSTYNSRDNDSSSSRGNDSYSSRAHVSSNRGHDGSSNRNHYRSSGTTSDYHRRSDYSSSSYSRRSHYQRK